MVNFHSNCRSTCSNAGRVRALPVLYSNRVSTRRVWLAEPHLPTSTTNISRNIVMFRLLHCLYFATFHCYLLTTTHSPCNCSEKPSHHTRHILLQHSTTYCPIWRSVA